MTSSEPNTNRAEIHSHSTASDGQHEPSEVARLCAEAGIEVWSLTDHDNCLGCAEAAEAARKAGIHFIPGIEISAYQDDSVHILGYGIAPEGPVIEEYSERRLEMRERRMERMVDACAGLDAPVEMERVVEISGRGGLGRPHLAKALVEAGHVDTEQQAFDRYIGYGRPACRVTTWPSVPEAIDIIHQAGGIAIAAHPSKKEDAERVPGWVEHGLDGIEVIHPAHTRAQTDALRRLATRLGVLRTASSDFHGTSHYSAEYFGKVSFPESWLDAFLERCG
ncbi:MAG: PHP domain-containing protein [Myxococcota bacterium]